MCLWVGIRSGRVESLVYANGTVRKLVYGVFGCVCGWVSEAVELKVCEWYRSQAGIWCLWMCLWVGSEAVELKGWYMRMVPFASWYMVANGTVHTMVGVEIQMVCMWANIGPVGHWYVRMVPFASLSVSATIAR